MKTKIRLPIIASALLLLLVATACTSGVQGRQEQQATLIDQVKTRDDAFRAFGAPDNIAHDGDDTLYYFVAGRESGGGIGLGTYVWQLLFLGREHLATDTNIVRVDSKGRVLSIERLDGQNIRRSSIWPGD